MNLTVKDRHSLATGMPHEPNPALLCQIHTKVKIAHYIYTSNALNVLIAREEVCL